MERSVAKHEPGDEKRTTKRAAAIHRAPIVWLAAALFAASLAGCIVTILLALGQPDDASPEVGERLLGVPAAHEPVGR